eukprot:TRINITY_DN8772_c0_g1_i4.p1 TRINITY_DN8772_c0_g1~~TRINITY_DN8772_c0_g1_i4.p1  ORF type:complete len:739 (-),score=80.87 TRINITY_DN8772_c0_g1_i4:237-2453(-)
MTHHLKMGEPSSGRKSCCLDALCCLPAALNALRVRTSGLNIRLCKQACLDFRKDCFAPPADWCADQTKYSYVTAGTIFLFYSLRYLIMALQDPQMYEYTTMAYAGIILLGVAGVPLMLVKRLSNARLQELVAVLFVFVGFVGATVQACGISSAWTPVYRTRTIALWRTGPLFVPGVLQWRLGTSLLYAFGLLVKDVAAARLVDQMHGDESNIPALLAVSLAVTLCYLPWTASLRKQYNTQQELMEERESLHRLLGMQCEGVIGLDAIHTIRSGSMVAVTGKVMIGESLHSCLSDESEQERVSAALERAKEVKQATLCPTTFDTSGEKVFVDLFVVPRRSGAESFLVGVRCVQEQLPPVAPSGDIAALDVMNSPSEITCEDSMSVAVLSLAPTKVTEQIFDVSALQDISEIINIGKKEHWLISQDSLGLEQSKRIGQGGFGQVVSANFYGANVAVKTHHPRTRNGELQFLSKEALLELRMLRHLRHPNIVGFIGALVGASNLEDSQLALVFENISDGLTAVDLLKLLDYKDLNCNHKVLLSTILVHVGSALLYMHGLKQPVLHRDVKASNVLIELLADGMVRAKLSDFGLSHIIGKDATGGTVSMMAPEALLGQHVSTAVDVFSFGRLLFHFVVGQKPLRTMDRNSIIQSAREGRVPALDWPEKDDVFPGCRQLSEACMLFQAERRPVMEHIFMTVEAWFNSGSLPSGPQASSSKPTLEKDTSRLRRLTEEISRQAIHL